MREVEPACVTAINYIISDDGTSNTCARLRLQLDDPNSPLEGRSFDVELPPPNCGHAEFVIPRHRFLASVRRKWQRGDCCQVCVISSEVSLVPFKHSGTTARQNPVQVAKRDGCCGVCVCVCACDIPDIVRLPCRHLSRCIPAQCQ